MSQILHAATRDRTTAPPGASLPRRIGAIGYDLFLLAAIWWCIGLLAVAIAGGEEVRAPHNRWLTAALGATSYLYFVWAWVHGGQTLGMKTWRLALRTDAGEGLTWARASARFFLAILSWLPLGLGYLWSLFDCEQRTWHDRLSATRLWLLPPR